MIVNLLLLAAGTAIAVCVHRREKCLSGSPDATTPVVAVGGPDRSTRKQAT